MKTKHKILIGLLVLIILIQFIRPERNIENNPSRYDIFHKSGQPTEVVAVVQTACYDCHSNRTAYPWYASVAPVSWMINNHIKEGKSHLNFSDWKLMDSEKQRHALDEVIEVLEKQEMPPKPYQWLHEDAKLEQAQVDLIIQWASAFKKQLN